jgi:hypothetical protein
LARSEAEGAGGTCGPTWAIRGRWPADDQPLQFAAARRKSSPSSNRPGALPSSKGEVFWRPEAMLSQCKPRRLGCEETLHPRLFLCLRCRQQVVICSRCDRGQVYCGRECASEVRRSRQRQARRRYQASERGRQMHADRSRRHRARGRRVTDQGPILVAPAARQPEPAQTAAQVVRLATSVTARRLTACYRCGNPVSNMVRQSPIRRPRRRPTYPDTGRPARRHRQIATDSDRR